jgi:hypothetical protein
MICVNDAERNQKIMDSALKNKMLLHKVAYEILVGVGTKNKKNK